ncbi:2-succinyl-5-enolpyruvyl-6-hydroxy-3-cyclohexene-1-carboxylic-acid synthase [bacterium]|nr:2-succinyl-5-enolpyruvyl-6-hydroxy-3-cyclohexene-1-carboxylic-acid synthase [bacterium]
MNIPNAKYLQAKLISDVLAQHAVERVVISPGSRSTPLARTFYLDERFRSTVLTDERSAAFFALGQAKASGKAVALICTSGTAGAHYYPAIIEAAQTGIPLVVLTADRPRSLRHTGAPQTIDQAALFGKYARMTIDLDSPSLLLEQMQESLYWIERAVRCAFDSPQGPVHINVPMEEPLVPNETEAEACARLAEQLKLSSVTQTPQNAVEVAKEDLQRLREAFCGLIVCGYDSARDEDEQNAIYGLARKLGWPILADVTSGLRFCGEPVVPFHDLFLRADELSHLAPDCVLEFGGYPTSKSLNHYLNHHRAWTLRVQRDSLPRDPDLRARKTAFCDVAQWCRDVTKSVTVSRDSLLLDPYQKAAQTIHHALGETSLDDHAGSEWSFVRAAMEALPDDSNLILASSMPVRYTDIFASANGKTIRVFSQRATNGIDGVLSHAAGISVASGRPSLLICGDLAFLHDLNGLNAVRSCNEIVILLLNNNGGGIFSFLPISEWPDTFEALHGTPTDVNFRRACEAYGIAWQEICKPSAFAFQGEYPRVFEVKTDRSRNFEKHQEFVSRILSRFER